MIEITTKTVYGMGDISSCVYHNVTIVADNTTVELGLLDQVECAELARVLRDAADELYDEDDDCPHINKNMSVHGVYCEDCDEVLEDNTGSNLMGG